MKSSDLVRQQWPLAMVVKADPDATDGLVRSVELNVPSAKSTMTRPIHKLVMLVMSEGQETNSEAKQDSS